MVDHREDKIVVNSTHIINPTALKYVDTAVEQYIAAQQASSSTSSSTSTTTTAPAASATTSATPFRIPIMRERIAMSVEEKQRSKIRALRRPVVIPYSDADVEPLIDEYSSRSSVIHSLSLPVNAPLPRQHSMTSRSSVSAGDGNSHALNPAAPFRRAASTTTPTASASTASRTPTRVRSPVTTVGHRSSSGSSRSRSTNAQSPSSSVAPPSTTSSTTSVTSTLPAPYHGTIHAHDTAAATPSLSTRSDNRRRRSQSPTERLAEPN